VLKPRLSFSVPLAVWLLAVPTLSSGSKPLIGWAQEAHPDYPADTFAKHLAEQKSYGANLVWIGHNNPGTVDKNKVEPGLSYAVYEAIRDEKSPLHADALAQAAAVKRLLDAARHEEMQAVLAIGYQIQMGPEWNKRHEDALRREHDGRLWTAGGSSASWLAPVYQHDIQEYYRWIDREWVVPYRNVIVMLNLADEPHGGDYSESAEAIFTGETGLSWEEAGQTDVDAAKKGHFQNLYVANYARWSANAWKTIDPAVRVTMSFCGSHGRFANFEPSIAAIFRDTPDNFDVTFDAFLIDNQPGDPIDGKHVSALALFLTQLGDLSRKYNKRVWLWPEANNWILSQWSPVKGNISDALFGVTLLRNMSDASGIQLGGLAVWNLDVKEQGLFRDTHPLNYDPQRMFEKISSDFKTEAQAIRLRDDVLVWIPESEADYLIGRKSYDYAERVYLLDIYAPLLERGILPRLSSDNEPFFNGIKTIFLVSKYAPKLSDKAYQALDSFVRGGGVLVSNYPILRPAGFWPRLLLSLRFYGNLLWASISHHPRIFTLRWGAGKMSMVFERMNETRRNIIHEIPPEIAEEISSISALPVDAQGARGLLAFPQQSSWIFYNTNPDSLRIVLRHPSKGTLVIPDGTSTPLSFDAKEVTLAHGAWLELAR
jgi:hypothetical protein